MGKGGSLAQPVDSSMLKMSVDSLSHASACMPRPLCPSAAHDPQMRQHFRIVLAEMMQAVSNRRMAPAREKIPTTFLLDWDDTCLCTSALEAVGAMADFDAPTPPALAAALEVLEMRVLSLLKTAHALGTVLIVTNAGDRWVELSAGRFLPSVRAFLDEHWRDIKIISARARYAEQYPTAPLQWKVRTFTDEISVLHPHAHLRLGAPASVIVLGDSVGDQYAAHAAMNEMALRQRALCVDATAEPAGSHAAGGPLSNLWLKVVKFLERPTVDQLSKELGVLLDHIRAMTTHTASFDVSMYNEGERNPPESSSPVSSSSSDVGAEARGRLADCQHAAQVDHRETPMEVSC